MATLKFDIPDDLQAHVERRAREAGHASVGEFVCELIASDKREEARSELEHELLRGLDSGPSKPMTRAEWNDLRQEVEDKAAAETL